MRSKALVCGLLTCVFFLVVNDNDSLREVKICSPSHEWLFSGRLGAAVVSSTGIGAVGGGIRSSSPKGRRNSSPTAHLGLKLRQAVCFPVGLWGTFFYRKERLVKDW